MKTTKTIFIADTVTNGILTGIDDSHVGVITSAVNEMANNPEFELIININSIGGAAESAIKIFNLLEPHRSKVTTKVSGNCKSAAVLILLAGETRVASKASSFMIHGTTWAFYGLHNFLLNYLSPVDGPGAVRLDLSTMSSLIGMLSRAADNILSIEIRTTQILRTRTKFTQKILQDRMIIEQNFTAQEALLLGLLTKIEENTTAPQLPPSELAS